MNPPERSAQANTPHQTPKSTQSTTQRSQQPTCYWYCGSRTQKAGESQQKCNKRSTNKNPYCSSQTCNNTNSAGQHNITQNKSPCCNSTKMSNSTATENKHAES